MIKSNNGHTELSGTGASILADFCSIVRTIFELMSKEGVSHDEIISLLSELMADSIATEIQEEKNV